MAKEISYRNDVQAVIAKAGCNLGTCHGNATGKGGFKMSLRGDDIDYDYAAMVQDVSGRRVNFLEPDRSLLLMKAVQGVAHEGGKRFDKDSWEYKTLRDWIAQGARRNLTNEPTLTKLEVTPTQKILIEPESEVQIKALATFSDGNTRDVTAEAVYEPAQVGLVEISSAGKVSKLQSGESTIIVRFLNKQQPVSLTFVPARPEFVWAGVKQNNFVDSHIFSKLKSLRMTPSKLVSDEVFIRRAYLDLLGFVPRAEEAKAFVADSQPDKREQLVDRLLARPEFVDFWTLKWADALRVESRTMDPKGMQTFHGWIRNAVAKNEPLDSFVRSILAAQGSTYKVPETNFYRAMREPNARAEGIARIFLGTRLQCAQCHNHPFDRWTQDDYFNWSAVFARIDYDVLENKGVDTNDKHAFNGEQIVKVAKEAKLTNPRTGSPAKATLLGAGELDAKVLDSQQELAAAAQWITKSENSLFAQAQANRIWSHLMGRGLVDPVDDFRATNPASHPGLLKQLAAELVNSGYDMRHLIRVIMASRSYQLSSEPNETNAGDEVNYSHNIIRRLTAEQLLDSMNQFVGVAGKFRDFPQYTRASQIPGPLKSRKSATNATDSMAFLAQFGQPPRLMVCECERTSDTNMSQAFSLIGSPQITHLVQRGDNVLNPLMKSPAGTGKIVEELYWRALTRLPTAMEKEKLVAFIDGASNKRAAMEDIAWSLINAKEFVLRF